MNTRDYSDAPSGVGPLADEWADKPHRLIYDLCKEVERLKDELAAESSLPPPPQQEQKDMGIEQWNRLVSAWFFGGLKSLKLTPKDGVDETKALRHIKAVLMSFEPKHEHKEAGCAYLLSEWFTNATWEKAEKVN